MSECVRCTAEVDAATIVVVVHPGNPGPIPDLEVLCAGCAEDLADWFEGIAVVRVEPAEPGCVLGLAEALEVADPDGAPPPDTPRTLEALLVDIIDAAGHDFAIAELTAAAIARGWVSTSRNFATIVATTLSNLNGARRISRTARGRYGPFGSAPSPTGPLKASDPLKASRPFAELEPDDLEPEGPCCRHCNEPIIRRHHRLVHVEGGTAKCRRLPSFATAHPEDEAALDE